MGNSYERLLKETNFFLSSQIKVECRAKTVFFFIRSEAATENKGLLCDSEIKFCLVDIHHI